MTNFGIAYLVLGLVLLLIGLILVGKYLYRRHKTFKKLSPLQAGHLRKENDMLSYLLADITENTTDWFLSHDHAVANGMCLVNDRKNIAVIYRETDISHLSIYMNLEALTNFSLTHADTVTLHITGNHVRKFVKKAETIIDKRGNELSFFKDELHKRL